MASHAWVMHGYLYTGVEELNGRINLVMILKKAFVKMNIFEENFSSQITSYRKNKEVYEN